MNPDLRMDLIVIKSCAPRTVKTLDMMSDRDE